MAYKSLSILQINLRKIKLPSITVCRNKDDNVFLIQEPYVMQNKPSLLAKEGFNLVHVDNFKSTIRATILVRNSLQAWRVDSLCTADTTVISVIVNNKFVFIASVYRAVQKNPD